MDDGEGGGSPYTLPAGATIAPGGFLVIHLPGALLNNSGDTVRLIQPDGVVVDSTSYTGSAPDVSSSRAPDGSWYDSPDPTPGAANTQPSVTSSASSTPMTSSATAPDASTTADSEAPAVRLNEVLPMPRDAFDAEWVEIAAEGDTPADLSGWKVDDGEGGGSPYTLPSGSIVGPHGLLVVTLPHALFNNDGDAVRLIRPDGTIADEFSYSSGTADLSFCLLDSGWSAECPPTPGAPNRPAAASTPPSGSAPQAPPADAPKAPGASDVPVVSVAAVALPRSAPGRQAMLLRTGGVGSPVYALAMPGALYSGIDLSTPTPQSAPPVPAPRRAMVAARDTEPAPARAPVAPIAGGLLLALGTIVAGYERLRPRVATPSDAAGGDSPEDDASTP